jgi:hypothetical protein
MENELEISSLSPLKIWKQHYILLIQGFSVLAKMQTFSHKNMAALFIWIPHLVVRKKKKKKKRKKKEEKIHKKS